MFEGFVNKQDMINQKCYCHFTKLQPYNMLTLPGLKQTVCCTPLSLKIALSVLFDTPMQNEHFTVILHSAVGLQKEGCLSNWNSGSLLWLDFYCRADQTPFMAIRLEMLG